MLTHIVCWKYKPEIDSAVRSKHIESLRALTGVISEIVSLNVGADLLHLERSFDTGLVAVFADRDALDRYTDHPEHQKVAAMGREISETVVSVDFLTGQG
jgi:Stress responsive A/B Barrel Domain